MKYINSKNILFVFVILLLPNVVFAYSGEVGFGSGFWHGLTFPFRLFLKLIWTNMTIYEQYDGTYWYHVGYLIGALGIFGGAASRS